MPEGPSLIILKEQLQSFTGKKVTKAGGYTPMETAWVENKKLLEIKTWGKHLLLRFTDGTIRIHLMLFGSATVNKRKKVNPTLYLRFGADEINFYVVQAKKIDQSLAKVYDWRTDIMSKEWDGAYVRKKLKEHSDEFIGDLLMNQEVFTGVGNIIRNEVLFRSRIHPLALVKDIPSRSLTVLLKQTRSYGKAFLEQRKAGKLSANWEAYEQSVCPRDGVRFKIEIIGKIKRKTYYCKVCQLLYRDKLKVKSEKS